MRKDYVKDESVTTEIEFVENYWTNEWVKAGGVAGVTADIKRTEEYRAIEPELTRLSPGAVVLDGGCGRGEWVEVLSGMGFAPIGLDISRQTVAELQKMFPSRRFVAGDIRSTGIEAQSLDAYISWGVFEHFEEGLQSCMREAFRMLRSGGPLMISVPFDNSRHQAESRRWSGLDRAASDCSNMRFYQWRLTRTELKRELEIAGFKVERIETIAYLEGISRLIHHRFGTAYGSRLHHFLVLLARLIVPRSYAAHMILAVARKPS